MTPKEKAKELVEKYANVNGVYGASKRCALISVYEIINELVKLSNGEFTFIHKVEYWQEVENEIKNYD